MLHILIIQRPLCVPHDRGTGRELGFNAAGMILVLGGLGCVSCGIFLGKLTS